MIKHRLYTNFFRFFETSTEESCIIAPVLFEDDFLGQAVDTTNDWTFKDTSAGGTTTPALQADSANGILRLTLDATNEKQESGLYHGDQRNLKLSLCPNIEFVASVATLPTDQAEIYFGLAGDYVEGPIAEADAGPAEHIFFCFDGSGLCKIFTDDTVHDNDAITTGITVVAGAQHIFRIDCTTPTDVKFYIDGVRVASGTTFNMNQVAALMLQPFAICHKETGTGVGTLDIDKISYWSKRS